VEQWFDWLVLSSQKGSNFEITQAIFFSKTTISLIEDEGEKQEILRAKRGFVDSIPKPISFEVFCHRLEKGDIRREAVAGVLAEVRNMGLRLICNSCYGPASVNLRTNFETSCRRSKDPCTDMTAQYTISPTLLIKPNGEREVRPSCVHKA
jgi:hypothetical protein